MTNERKAQNPKEILQQINILFFALIAGQLLIFFALFFAVGQLERTSFGPDESLSVDPLTLIGSIIFFSALGLSFFLYKKRKEAGAQMSGSLMEKLEHYRKSFIIRVFFLEGGNLVAILYYFFISLDIIFVAYFGLGLLLFLMARPTADRISQDYQLSGAEQNELRTGTI